VRDHPSDFVPPHATAPASLYTHHREQHLQDAASSHGVFLYAQMNSVRSPSAEGASSADLTRATAVPDYDGTTREDWGASEPTCLPTLQWCQRPAGRDSRLEGAIRGQHSGDTYARGGGVPHALHIENLPHCPLNVRQWGERSTPEIPYSWIRSHGLPLCRRALEADSPRFRKELKRLRLPIGTRR
jgi:hypothetical protein